MLITNILKEKEKEGKIQIFHIPSSRNKYLSTFSSFSCAQIQMILFLYKTRAVFISKFFSFNTL